MTTPGKGHTACGGQVVGAGFKSDLSDKSDPSDKSDLSDMQPAGAFLYI